MAIEKPVWLFNARDASEEEAPSDNSLIKAH